MNWFRTILDGVAMSAVFNSYVAVFWLLKPHSFITMFPKDLQKRVRPVTKEERRHTILMYVTLYPAVLAWMILSAYQAGINGFWPMFWTAYVEMMLISLGDLFFLDYGKGLTTASGYLGITSSPVMDGVLLSEDTASIMPEGRFPGKPVLVGSTGDEMKMVDNKSWYKKLGIAMNEADFRKKCETVYGEAGTRLAEAIRPTAKDLPDLQFKVIEIPMFHASVLKALERFAKKTDAYGYRMNYVPGIWNGMRGAYHCAELPLFFGTVREIPDIPKAAMERNLRQSEVLQNDWIAFMKTGALPGGEAFAVSEQIRIYDGTGYEDRPFPQKEEISAKELPSGSASAGPGCKDLPMRSCSDMPPSQINGWTADAGKTPGNLRSIRRGTKTESVCR